IACAIVIVFPVAILTFVRPKHENEARPRTRAEDYMTLPPWIPFLFTLAYRRHHDADWIAGVKITSPNRCVPPHEDRSTARRAFLCDVAVLLDLSVADSREHRKARKSAAERLTSDFLGVYIEIP
ncbi:hypothetical protein EJB05_27818, partial [Eragrostis curvula]